MKILDILSNRANLRSKSLNLLDYEIRPIENELNHQLHDAKFLVFNEVEDATAFVKPCLLYTSDAADE